MPLTERDPNITGRFSRASNFSQSSTCGPKSTGRDASPEQSTIADAPGVLSMLKTSTELGDIGAPGAPQSKHLVANGRQSRRARNGTTSLSRSSSRRSFSGSQLSRHSSTWSGKAPSLQPGTYIAHRPRPTKSRQDAFQLSSMADPGRFPAPPSRDRPTRSSDDGRTSIQSQAKLEAPDLHGGHRSMTSLRGNAPPPRAKSPFVYPTRLKRPGYRPSSPAMSESTGSRQRRLQYASNSRSSSASPFDPHGMNHFASRKGPHRSAPSLQPPNAAASPGVQSASVVLSTKSRAVSRSDVLSPLPSRHTVVVRLQKSPHYYDYSESFQNRAATSSNHEAAEANFGNNTQDLQVVGLPLPEEDDTDDVAAIAELYASNAIELPAEPTAELPSELPAELPASPVVRRLTRELIKSMVDVVSDDIDESEVKDAAPLGSSKELSVAPSQSLSRSADACSEPPSALSKDVTPRKEQKSGEIAVVIPATGSPVGVKALVSTFGGSAPTSVRSKTSMATTVLSPERSITTASSPVTSTSSHSGPPNSIASTKKRSVHGATPFQGVRRQSETETTSATRTVESSSVGIPINAPKALEERPAAAPTLSKMADKEFVLESDTVNLRDAPSESESKKTVTLSQEAHLSVGPRPEPSSDTGKAWDSHSLPARAKDEEPRANHDHIDILQNARKSFAQHLSAMEDMRDAARFSRDTVISDISTTDLRFTGLWHPLSKLSDLQEDSQEDTSTTNLRTLGFTFPVRGRSSIRVSKDSIPRQAESSAIDRLGLIELSRPLAEVRALPSLNFSRVDLFAKLNQALEVRSSWPSIRLGTVDAPKAHSFGIGRPNTSVALVEPYRSFFSRDFSADSENTEQEQATADTAATPVSKILSVNEVDIVAEVNRLSIPSVNGLSQRLSELLPSLKRYNPQGEGETITSDEMLEQPSDGTVRLSDNRASTLMSGHASSEFRELAAAANLVATSRNSNVRSEDEASVITKDFQPFGLMKALPPLPGDGKALEFVTSPESQNQATTTTSAGEVCLRVSVAELQAPPPALTRKKSNLGIPHEETDYDQEPQAHIRDSPTNSRPWNRNENYPWSDGAPTIEITFPVPAHHGEGSKTPRSPLRRSQSAQHISQTFTSPLPRSLSTATASPRPARGNGRKRKDSKNSKRSILGSISRKMGLNKASSSAGAFASRARLRQPGDTTSFQPGDRYPTSSLTPPSAINLAEIRSFFSDDSEQTVRQASFRKRLTALKRGRTSTRAQSQQDDYGSIGQDAASLFEVPGVVGHGATLHPQGQAVGMGKVEFRARKVVDRLKSFWFKSGELLRSMSGRTNKVGHSWDRDSDVYSGT